MSGLQNNITSCASSGVLTELDIPKSLYSIRPVAGKYDKAKVMTATEVVIRNETKIADISEDFMDHQINSSFIMGRKLQISAQMQTYFSRQSKTLGTRTLEEPRFFSMPTNVQGKYTFPLDANQVMTKTCITKSKTSGDKSYENGSINIAAGHENHLKPSPTSPTVSISANFLQMTDEFGVDHITSYSDNDLTVATPALERNTCYNTLNKGLDIRSTYSMYEFVNIHPSKTFCRTFTLAKSIAPRPVVTKNNVRRISDNFIEDKDANLPIGEIMLHLRAQLNNSEIHEDYTNSNPVSKNRLTTVASNLLRKVTKIPSQIPITTRRKNPIVKTKSKTFKSLSVTQRNLKQILKKNSNDSISDLEYFYINNIAKNEPLHSISNGRKSLDNGHNIYEEQRPETIGAVKKHFPDAFINGARFSSSKVHNHHSLYIDTLPLLNSGIAISPGEVITTNFTADVIIGTPKLKQSPTVFRSEIYNKNPHGNPLEISRLPTTLLKPHVHRQYSTRKKSTNPHTNVIQFLKPTSVRGYLGKPQKKKPDFMPPTRNWHNILKPSPLHSTNLHFPELSALHSRSTILRKYPQYRQQYKQQLHMPLLSQSYSNQQQYKISPDLKFPFNLKHEFNLNDVVKAASIDESSIGRQSAIKRQILALNRPTLFPTPINNIPLTNDDTIALSLTAPLSVVRSKKHGQYRKQIPVSAASVFRHSNHQKINFDTDVLSHAVNINAAPLLFKKEGDYQHLAPVRGEIQQAIIHIPQNKQHVNLTITPHHMISDSLLMPIVSQGIFSLEHDSGIIGSFSWQKPFVQRNYGLYKLPNKTTNKYESKKSYNNNFEITNHAKNYVFNGNNHTSEAYSERSPDITNVLQRFTVSDEDLLQKTQQLLTGASRLVVKPSVFMQSDALYKYETSQVTAGNHIKNMLNTTIKYWTLQQQPDDMTASFKTHAESQLDFQDISVTTSKHNPTEFNNSLSLVTINIKNTKENSKESLIKTSPDYSTTSGTEIDQILPSATSTDEFNITQQVQLSEEKNVLLAVEHIPKNGPGTKQKFKVPFPSEVITFSDLQNSSSDTESLYDVSVPITLLSDTQSYITTNTAVLIIANKESIKTLKHTSSVFNIVTYTHSQLHPNYVTVSRDMQTTLSTSNHVLPSITARNTPEFTTAKDAPFTFDDVHYKENNSQDDEIASINPLQLENSTERKAKNGTDSMGTISILMGDSNEPNLLDSVGFNLSIPIIVSEDTNFYTTGDDFTIRSDYDDYNALEYFTLVTVRDGSNFNKSNPTEPLLVTITSSSNTYVADITTAKEAEVAPLDIPTCRPACQSSRNELCVSETHTHFRCLCRPGFARISSDRPCKPTYTYVMKIYMHRLANDVLRFEPELTNTDSDEFRQLAVLSHDAVHRMIIQSDFRDIYHGVHLTSFGGRENADNTNISWYPESGIVANFLLQLSENSDEARLQNVLKKYLRLSNYSIGGAKLYTDQNDVEPLTIFDFDECSEDKFHDCSTNARCFNLRGTYTCSCREGFADLSDNALLPGRFCSAEAIGCEKCHYHGKCVVPIKDADSRNAPICECFEWYRGPRCQLNFKILLMSLMTVGTLLIILLIFCILFTYNNQRMPLLLQGSLKKLSRKKARLRTPAATSFRHKQCCNMETKSPSMKECNRKCTQKSVSCELKIESLAEKKEPTLSMNHNNSVHMSEVLLPQQSVGQSGSILGTVLAQSIKDMRCRFLEQSNRSLTVMIPRAKYHHASLSPRKSLLRTQLTKERAHKHILLWSTSKVGHKNLYNSEVERTDLH